MKLYVTDTQCLLWHLTHDRRLPREAQSVFKAMEEGRAQISVPSISLVEALYLLQRQRVSETTIDYH